MKTKYKNKDFSHDDALAYIKALKTPWQTMQHDISLALEIIRAEVEQPIQQVALLDKVEHVENEIHFSFPDWHAPVEAHFVAQYGKAQGSFIFDKVLMQLFKRAQGETRNLH